MEPSGEVRARLQAGKEESDGCVDDERDHNQSRSDEDDEDTAVSRDHLRSGEDPFNASFVLFKSIRFPSAF